MMPFDPPHAVLLLLPLRAANVHLLERREVASLVQHRRDRTLGQIPLLHPDHMEFLLFHHPPIDVRLEQARLLQGPWMLDNCLPAK